MSKLRLVSLFSGYGTQELALKYSNIDYVNIANCDILKSANIAYDSLHTTELGNLGDITKIDEKEFPECDFLTYSFPCQDISISGKQQGIKKGTRSGLLYEVERIVEHNKPKFLLMENVKNLISKSHIESFEEYISKLNKLGYGNSWIVLNGADFGCPQNRERVFMMSVLNESSESVRKKLYSINKIERSGGHTVPMRPFLEKNVDSELYIDAPITESVSKMKTTCKLVARRDDVKYDQGRRIYSIDSCSPCLTTSGSPQIMLDNGKFRKISAREGYRFMGLKDCDIDKLLTTKLSTNQHVSLAGNSICVPVMSAIFDKFFVDYKKTYNNLEEKINMVKTSKKSEKVDDEDFFDINLEDI
jgi:DNA-cytosine methyltransferase